MRTNLRRLLTLLAVVTLGMSLSAPAARAEAEPLGPELVAISFGPGPHGVDLPAPVRIEVTKPEELASIDVVLRSNATGHWVQDSWDAVADASVGTYGFVVEASGERSPWNGMTYTVERVMLINGEGRSTVYWGDGTKQESWPIDRSRQVDFSATLSFTGSTRDDKPPVVESIHIAQPDIVANDWLRIDYRVGGGDVDHLVIWGIDDKGWVGQLGAAYGNPLPSSGFTTQQVNDVGRMTLYRVDITDVNGNHARYYPDGRLTTGTEVHYEAVTTTHTADLETAAVTARPGPATGATATARNGGVLLRWSQERYAGYAIVVQPGGRTLTTASTGDYQREELVTGLTNGTTYTFTITPTSDYDDGGSVTTTASPRMGPMRVFGTGDRSRDGRPDLWAAPVVADPSANATWRIFQGSGAGGFGRTLSSAIPATRSPIPGSATGRGPGASLGALYLSGSDLVEPTSAGSRVVGKGFGIFRTMDASADLTGDGVADLIGITPAGDFHVYTSTATGAIRRGVRLGGGWGAFQSVFSPGDFNGDNRSDLLAVDGLGRLWLYPGNGRGAFGARALIGSGWNTFGSVFPMRDFSGDGRVDLGAITMDGRLFMYPGNGRGSFLAKRQIGTGWGMYL